MAQMSAGDLIYSGRAVYLRKKGRRPRRPLYVPGSAEARVAVKAARFRTVFVQFRASSLPHAHALPDQREVYPNESNTRLSWPEIHRSNTLLRAQRTEPSLKTGKREHSAR